jgi:hypothetical protein
MAQAEGVSFGRPLDRELGESRKNRENHRDLESCLRATDVCPILSTQTVKWSNRLGREPGLNADSCFAELACLDSPFGHGLFLMD